MQKRCQRRPTCQQPINKRQPTRAMSQSTLPARAQPSGRAQKLHSQQTLGPPRQLPRRRQYWDPPALWRCQRVRRPSQSTSSRLLPKQIHMPTTHQSAAANTCNVTEHTACKCTAFWQSAKTGQRVRRPSQSTQSRPAPTRVRMPTAHQPAAANTRNVTEHTACECAAFKQSAQAAQCHRAHCLRVRSLRAECKSCTPITNTRVS